MDNAKKIAGFTTGGQPSAEEIAALAARGVRTVVNVRMPGETDLDERALVEAAGLRYLEIPFNWDTLTPEHVDRLGAALGDTPPEAVLVH